MREANSSKLKGKNYLRRLCFSVCLLTFAISLSPSSAFAQSSDQNFPTHVTGNEINGFIKARSLGDGRLTTYFYLFEGSQGDIFINVATKNFSGDIDVFTINDLRPLTKMVMYADGGTSETGRLIYLRQPARMLLRIEGRTPNDDAAEFRIKFAGSFVALAPDKYAPPPTVTKQSAVSGQQPAAKTSASKSEPSGGETGNDENPKTEDPKPSTEDTVYENKSAKVTVKPVKPPPAKRTTTTRTRSTKPKSTTQKPKPPAEKASTETSRAKPDPAPDPLANIKLVIVFKNGETLAQPMTEILRFSFDRGTLTVIEKTGKIEKYQISAIAKVTIE